MCLNQSSELRLLRLAGVISPLVDYISAFSSNDRLLHDKCNVVVATLATNRLRETIADIRNNLYEFFFYS